MGYTVVDAHLYDSAGDGNATIFVCSYSMMRCELFRSSHVLYYKINVRPFVKFVVFAHLPYAATTFSGFHNCNESIPVFLVEECIQYGIYARI